MEALYDQESFLARKQYELLTLGLKKLTMDTLIIKQPKNAVPWIKGIVSHERFNRSCRFDLFYLNGVKLTEDNFIGDDKW